MVLSFLFLFWLLLLNSGFVIKNLPIYNRALSYKKDTVENIFVNNINYSTHYQYASSNINSSNIAILLIHGFASNHNHWRSNINVLSKTYDTYALDLVGFGNSSQFSDYPYTVSMWSSQVLYFIENIIKRPCILVGNSLGGYIALASSIKSNPNIVGIITINPVVISKKDNKNNLFGWFSTKSIIKSYFHFIKKKSTIQSFLKNLYPNVPTKVDDFLINSIEYPSFHPNASDIFYKVLLENVLQPSVFIENILPELSVPLLVIYGKNDPWIKYSSIKKIIDFYPNSGYIPVDAGHCPHDEIPEIINPLIIHFVESISQK